MKDTKNHSKKTKLPKKIAVIGCGSIGRRHLQNLLILGVTNVILCDPDSSRLRKLAAKFHIKHTFTDYKDALDTHHDIVAAIICTPTHLHIPVALFCAQRGIHLMIEKPLSHSRQGIGTLTRIAQQKNLVCMMAMCYRFHPVYKNVKKLINKEYMGTIYSVDISAGYYLPFWHPRQDYRKEYSARKDMGGGVILTSGIHIFDIIRWLFGEVGNLACVASKASNLKIDVEDTMECIMKLESGSIIRLHLDFLRPVNEHRFVILAEKGMIEGDILKQRMNIRQKEGKHKRTVRYQTPLNEMYKRELHHFLNCINRETSPIPGIQEGAKSLALTLRAKNSAIANS